LSVRIGLGAGVILCSDLWLERVSSLINRKRVTSKREGILNDIKHKIPPLFGMNDFWGVLP
jgi:hypothetical protein